MVPIPAAALACPACKDAALDLLRQPVPSREVIRPELYRRTTLAEDVARLGDRRVGVDEAGLFNVLLKFFFSYAYPGAESLMVPLGEISQLLRDFAARGEESSLEADPRFVRRLRSYESVLAPLSDLPRSAAMLRVVASRRLPREPFDGKYVGLCLGAGSGLLMLAQFLQSQRSGFTSRRIVGIVGIESDRSATLRTRELCAALGFGEVHAEDAGHPAVFELLGLERPAFVCNEALPETGRRVLRSDFLRSHAALAEALGPELHGAEFFPEGLVVLDPYHRVSVVLSRKNGFRIPEEHRGLDFYPQGLAIDGRLVPYARLGEEYRHVVPHAARRLLGRRL